MGVGPNAVNLTDIPRPFCFFRVSGRDGKEGTAFVALGLRPGRLRSKPQLFLRYCCRSRGNCRFGLIFTRYFAQHVTNAVQIEVQRFCSAVDSKSLKNKRVSVSARAKLSWPTETLAK